MVLMCQPIVDAMEAIKTENSLGIMLTPQGKTYTQSTAKKLCQNYNHLILLCGHYEGFDERINNFVDMSISVGDYVLTGGEIPAMIITDSVVRLIDDVINKDSYENDSFSNNLLDYPTYTKPQDFRGFKVPDILLSGNHAKIDEWRLMMQKEKTKKCRPDLLDKK